MTRMSALTAVLAGSVLALAGCAGQEPPPAARPTATVTVTAAPATSDTPAPTPTRTDSPASGEAHLFTRLNGHRGYRDASGSAEYDQDRDGRELEIHATQLQELAGRSVAVYIQRTRVGTMVVSSSGVAHRDWETDHGDRLPIAGVDDRVHILAGNGDVVLSGRLKTDLSH